jgi:hypothetical protein
MFFYVHSNLRTATRPLGPEKVVIVHKKLLQGMSGQFQQCVYGQLVNIPAAPANRTNAVWEGIHNNAIRYTHLKYLKYFFIAGLPKAIMQLVASKDYININ